MAKPMSRQRKWDELRVGAVFGRWTVNSIESSRHGRFCICTCQCSKTSRVKAHDLIKGGSTSCGCFQREWISKRNWRHGQYHTKTNRAWAAMMTRCRNPKSNAYRDYGGRGITVCERWNLFENFLKDMGEAPVGMTLDRINNYGNYEPSNCRWASRVVQQNNRRGNRMVEFNGKTMTAIMASREYGIPVAQLYRGWSVSKCLERLKQNENV